MLQTSIKFNSKFNKVSFQRAVLVVEQNHGKTKFMAICCQLIYTSSQTAPKWKTERVTAGMTEC